MAGDGSKPPPKARREPTRPPGNRAGRTDWGDAGPVAAAMAVAAAAILIVFARFDPTAALGPDGHPTTPAIPAGPAGSWIEDEATGLRFRLPSDWRLSTSDLDDQGPGDLDDHPLEPGPSSMLTPPGEHRATTDPPTRRSTYISDFSPATLSLELWPPDPDRAPLFLWLGVTRGDLRPVDGGPLPNATIAGAPAAVMSSPAPPREYAAFFERDSSYLAVTFELGDNPPGESNASGDALMRMVLESLTWPGSPDHTALPEHFGTGLP